MRLKEIEERLAQIKAELTTRAAELKEEEITALEKEVTALQEERAAITAAAEKRSALLARIAAGENVDDGNGGEGQQRVLRNFKGAAGEGDNDDKYGSMEYRKAFMKYVCRGEALPKEYRADAVSKSTDVGAVIPTTVLNQIVEKLESTGMILALVTRTAYKGGVSIPVSTVKPTATWVNEGAGSDKQKKNIAKDGMITFAYHKLRCAVAVSLEVDTMAISAFETLLINNIVEAMTKALEQAIIDGNGTGKPKGILAETPADGQTIESAAPSYSDLIKAEGALPMAYENGAVWCMSKKTFMEYVGMTDKNGQPTESVQTGGNEYQPLEDGYVILPKDVSYKDIDYEITDVDEDTGEGTIRYIYDGHQVGSATAEFTDKYLQKVSTRKERVDSKPKDVDNSGDSKKNGGKSSAKSIWKNFLQKVKAVWDFGQKKFAGKSTTEKYVIAGGCVALVILIFSLIVLLIRRRR